MGTARVEGMGGWTRDVRVGVGGRAGEGLDGRDVDGDDEVRLGVEVAARAEAGGVVGRCAGARVGVSMAWRLAEKESARTITTGHGGRGHSGGGGGEGGEGGNGEAHFCLRERVDEKRNERGGCASGEEAPGLKLQWKSECGLVAN